AANLRMSVNLAHHGVISLSRAPPYLPTMYREPLPVIVSAGTVQIVDYVLGQASDETYFSGQYAKAIKYQNVGWLLLLAAGVLVAARRLSGSLVLALLAVGLLVVKIPATPTSLAALGIDTLETDLPAAALLLWGSIYFSRAIANGRGAHFFYAGLFFGALALTKAAFFYIFFGVLGSAWLLGTVLRERTTPPWGRMPSKLLLLAAGCAILTLPWMARNMIQLDTFSIAQRGGLVLLFRAEKNLMTAEEYRGTFYIWAPEKLRPLMGRLLGYTHADVQRGGRLQHIYRDKDSDHFESDLAAELAGRPDLALSYYHRVRAERIKLENQLGRSPEAMRSIDQQLQTRAVSLIKTHPFRHIGTVVPFLWRGAPTTFPILLLALILALARRNREVAAFALPAFGLVMFYALFSHFTPRYSVPAVGVTLVVLLWLFASVLRWMRGRPSAARGATGAAA
ncbi:MAG: hypothetical protein ABIT36_09330, partial [Steroidobacteraceae bacterium]